MTTIPSITLNNGVLMPQLGLGTWQARDGDEVEQAVTTALSAGYRLIDTAAMYANEAGVGSAIKNSGIAREDIFLTTKLWNGDQGYDEALRAFDASLKRLGLDYIDLYLIHWPMPTIGKFVDTWKALEKLYADKRVRAIGVSNFMPAHLTELLWSASITPTVNQIELHPRLSQEASRAFCKQHGIQVESYSPLMRGQEILADATIQSIAVAHGKTPAQVTLRWHIQHGLIVIPKSVTPARIQENAAIFDFALTPEEMQRIDNMNTNSRIGGDPNTFSVGARPWAT